MAVYTTITQTEAQQLFKPLGEIKKFEGIREGVENTNYLVHLNDSKKYILTIFEKRTNEKDLPYFNKLMKLFHTNGVSCPLSVTIKNEDLFRINEKPCCIYSFVEGRPLLEINKVKFTIELTIGGHNFYTFIIFYFAKRRKII